MRRLNMHGWRCANCPALAAYSTEGEARESASRHQEATGTVGRMHDVRLTTASVSVHDIEWGEWGQGGAPVTAGDGR